MSRERFLTIAVVFLSLLNAGTLTFLFLGSKHRPPHPVRMEKLIPESLEFDKKQIVKFDALRHEHHSQMIVLDKQNKEVLISYLGLLKADSVNSIEKDSLERIISTIQQQRAHVTLQHFEKLKAVCTAEQNEKFNALIPELIRVMTDTHQPKP